MGKTNIKCWTVAIGDDKVLNCLGEWATTQEAYNYYNENEEINDLMTYEEATKKAEELNIEEELFFCNNKYYVIELSKD